MKDKAKKAVMAGLALKVALTAGLLGVGCAQGGDEEPAVAPSHSAMVAERIGDELGLDEAQQGRIQNAVDIVHQRREAMRAERETHFPRLLEAIESGEVNDDEVHGHIDAKIDEIRAAAHQVADEAIALVRSLDDEQRANVAAKIERFHDRMEAFHERMEAEGGGLPGPLALREHLRERLCSEDGGELGFPFPGLH